MWVTVSFSVPFSGSFSFVDVEYGALGCDVSIMSTSSKARSEANLASRTPVELPQSLYYLLGERILQERTWD